MSTPGGPDRPSPGLPDGYAVSPGAGSAPFPAGSGPGYGGGPHPTYPYPPAAQRYGGVAAVYAGPPIPGMARRLVARLLDSAIIFAVEMVVFFGFLGGVTAITAATTDPTTGEPPSGAVAAVAAVYLVVVLVLVLLTLAYEVVLVALRGATVGKQVLGIRVVRLADGAVPGWGPSILRWVVPQAASLVTCGLGGIVVYLSPFLDSTGAQRGWHDTIAKTHVVSA